MSDHRLWPLLNPKSIAVLGASRKVGTVGNEIIVNLHKGSFQGSIYPINPNYSEVMGHTCYQKLSHLPEIPDHVILAVSDQRIEGALDQVISNGIKACTIFSALIVEGDETPTLKQRIKSKVQDSDLLVAGANCMGIFNIRDRVWAGAYDTRHHSHPGNVSLISQSGAGMQCIFDCEQRLDFNFAVSAGCELSVSMEDYLDYALDLPETRVVGLFLETARNPKKFFAALRKAAKRGIPIVVLKVGRTVFSAELALSHSGALTGSDRCYDAVFENFGVQRVDDLDQLATALIMFAQPNQIASGDLVCLHDSGGERQLLVDLADSLNVPLAQLGTATVKALENILDPGLPAVNPLDAWAGGAGASDKMSACFTTLLKDPSASFGALVHDRGPNSLIYPEYLEHLQQAHEASGKPVFLVSNRQGSGYDQLAIDSTKRGLPVIDGVSQFLVGTRCLLSYRDFEHRGAAKPPSLNQGKVSLWREKLLSGIDLNEEVASKCLSDFGITMLECSLVNDYDSLLAAAENFGYPLVLKTAAQGVHHKSEVGGVVLDLQSSAELENAYTSLSRKLGNSVIVASMLESAGEEMILGMFNDSQFGPVVVIGFGGLYAEVLGDTRVLMPPFDEETVARAIGQLSMSALLSGVRGREAVDVKSYCKVAALFSVFVMEFSDLLAEIDINPVMITKDGCIGLDSLFIRKNLD